MGKLFGTDGVRGRSNSFPMDAETVLKIGMAAGAYFTRGGHKHTVIIGKDTRLSGYMIEPALTAGFIAMGMDVFLVGPMPTPAVAMLTRGMRSDIGVMISASHNPYEDNGIKFFEPNGLKLSDTAQSEIEALMKQDLTKFKATPDKIGRARRIEDAAGRYIESVKHTFPKRNRLDGLKIVLDCANGAGYKIAPTVLWELGAEVIKIGCEPDGYNINENCGSTSPEELCRKVLEKGADIGIALDGDADRVIICDENGKLIDGDQIMGAIAEYWHDKGLLTGNGIVATIMSNMALEKFLNSKGLKLERAKVGDRYVSEMMREGGYNFGGEQSGHIIFNDYTTTGDGLVAALQALAKMVESGKVSSEALRVFEPMPQVLKNVRYDASKANPLEERSVIDFIAASEKKLDSRGRIVIRKSGTEPLIRVMAEGEDEKEINLITDEIVEKIKAA